jgi:uncharacterized protein (TIGR00725 family)
MHYIAVVGSGDATEEELEAAEQVGVAIAEANAVLICGGLGGVMEAACHGRKTARPSASYPATTA